MTIDEYYKQLSAQGHAAIRERKARGEVMHLAPLGFKNARDKHGRSILVPDPKTLGPVREARRMQSEGLSIRVICRAMSFRGLRSSRGKQLGPSSMLLLLSRPNETIG